MGKRFAAAIVNALNNPQIIWPENERPDSPSPGNRGSNAVAVAKHTRIDDLVFDSAGEAERHAVLLRWVKAGVITDLATKPTFALLPGLWHPSVGRVKAVAWQADWEYRQLIEPYLVVIEDFKGPYRHRSFRDKLPLILHVLAERHVFINEQLEGWYSPYRAQ